jgi:hypothetical protein
MNMFSSSKLFYLSISFFDKLFNRIEKSFEEERGKRFVGVLLVLSFISTLAIIEMNQRNWIPDNLKTYVPHSDFQAISITFNLLLSIEIISLILNLTHSVANSVGKQFEVLSLILIRDTFKELAHYSDVLIWTSLVSSIPTIVATALGGLAIFALLGLYYRQQKHQPITLDQSDRFKFIAFKKIIALILLVGFIYLVFRSSLDFLYKTHHYPSAFESFYTLLIFSDILLVLLSMVYSSSYHIAFRNSGFAVATVMIRISLVAPFIYSAVLGVGAMLFVIGLTLAYNYFIEIKIGIPEKR